MIYYHIMHADLTNVGRYKTVKHLSGTSIVKFQGTANWSIVRIV